MELDFRKINFGYASAEKESARAPELLLDGYIDLRNLTGKALSDRQFLFLGYKGSGKSAIGQRLELIYQDDPTVFVSNVSLADFQYTMFSSLVANGNGTEARYPTGWAWILCVYCFTSLARDAACRSQHPAELPSILNELRTLGLLPDASFSKILETARERHWAFGIPGIAEVNFETDKDAHFAVVTKTLEMLRRVLSTTTTPNRHYIVLDGLDDILSSASEQYKSLAALIYEIDKFNDFLFARAPFLKIILLCRTDIFEVIGGSNRNKVRQDSGEEIIWFSDPKNPQSSRLVEIANLRAKLALERDVDIFRDLLPDIVMHRPTINVLMDMTRHTPRDFLQLLTYVKESSRSPRPNQHDIINGMRRYSVEYFLPEIFDEMEGYCSAAELREVFRLIGGLRSRDFSYQQLLSRRESERSNLDDEKIKIILHSLFECSAIGNVNLVEAGQGRREYYMISYRFRNRHVAFNRDSRMILHRGLWRAFNLPDTGALSPRG